MAREIRSPLAARTWTTDRSFEPDWEGSINAAIEGHEKLGELILAARDAVEHAEDYEGAITHLRRAFEVAWEIGYAVTAAESDAKAEILQS